MNNMQLAERGGVVHSGRPRAAIVGDAVAVTPQGFAACVDLQVIPTRQPAASQVKPGLTFTPDVPGRYSYRVSGQGLSSMEVTFIAFPSGVLTSRYMPDGRDQALNVITSALSKIAEQATACLESGNIPKSFGLHNTDLTQFGGAPR